MKYLIFALFLSLSCVGYSQSSEPTKTELSIKVGETKYPIFKGSRGGYYILRLSAKGTTYKQYLTDAQRIKAGLPPKESNN